MSHLFSWSLVSSLVHVTKQFIIENVLLVALIRWFYIFVTDYISQQKAYILNIIAHIVDDVSFYAQRL